MGYSRLQFRYKKSSPNDGPGHPLLLTALGLCQHSHAEIEREMVKMAAAGLLLQLLLVLSCVMLVLVPVTEALPTFKCPTAFWVFGDSLTDTGNSQTVFPTASRLVAPYGESYTFRDKPGLNRFSNGRLIVDFVAQAFRFPFFGTYSHVLNGANYVKGTNFAYSGATANATNFITPFHLNLQVDQFLNFKTVLNDTFFRLIAGITLEPIYKPPLIDPFTQGAYYIPEIGGNDFAVATLFLNLPSLAVIATFVPAAAAAVKQAITTLHDSGGRLFFVGNTPPQGCNPAQLTRFGSRPRDSLGCVDEINSINREYAVRLQQVVAQLQANYTDSLIYLFDIYNASIEIFTNPATYGFTNTNQSCCGVGGPYNYNSAFTCGNFVSCCPGTPACSNPASYISWDGIHYTEAFYRQIAKFFLKGLYLSPPLNLTTTCNLDFSAFNRTS